MPFVLDASVAVAWCLEDETCVYADRVQERLTTEMALVPPIWGLEVGNALVFAEARGRIGAADVARVTGLLCALPITVDSTRLQRDLGSVLTVARTQHLTTYDAAYLELASREALPLATLDARLRSAANNLGIRLLE